MFNLYLKKHNVTGMKYLGYTEKDDCEEYTGSGTYWKKHIKKHGYDVTTTLIGQYDTEEELKEWGIYYSKKYDIVASKEFANLKTEEGVGGSYSEESKRIMSEKAKLRPAPKTAWTSEQISELNKKTWANDDIRKRRSEGISKALTGRKNGPRNEEFKKHLSEKLKGKSFGGNVKGSKKNQKEVTCPHCGKIGKGPNMTRYHFDKCKTTFSN